MTTISRACRLLAILAALCVSSASRAAPDAVEAPTALPSETRPATSLNPLASVAPAEMTNFTGRPLFTASRRPYRAPTVVAAAPPAPPPAPSASHIRLIGTVRMPGGSSALIQDRVSNVTRTVESGGMIDGWRVIGIEETGIRIEQGGQTLDLAMFKPGEPAPPPTAPASGAQAAPTTLNAPSAPPPAPLPPVARSVAPGAAPPGTVAGTAAAEAAANSPYRLTFGTTPKTGTP